MNTQLTIQRNVDLQAYHTFACPTKAAFFVSVKDEKMLCEALTYAQKEKLPLCVLGGGSNVLFRKDFKGLVLQIDLVGIRTENQTDHVLLHVGAGHNWHDLVCYAVKNNYAGIENLAYIPGTVGAAPIQNIGAYGAELKDVFHSLNAVHRQNLQKKTFHTQECQFDYRYSRFKAKDDWVITEVTLALKKKATPNLKYPELKQAIQQFPKPSIQDIATTIQNIRMHKLPDPNKIGNAGSFFKNPVLTHSQWEMLRKKYPQMPSFPAPEGKIKLSAGWLIEDCGWKGYRQDNIGVHPQHALVLVHRGATPGEELWKLATRIQKSVHDRFQISLEPEVRVY